MPAPLSRILISTQLRKFFVSRQQTWVRSRPCLSFSLCGCVEPVRDQVEQYLCRRCRPAARDAGRSTRPPNTSDTGLDSNSYPRFVAKLRWRFPSVILDGPGSAARSQTFYRPPPRSPEKPNPSRRLDRDGERVIMKVVAGTRNHRYRHSLMVAI
jgi:hypothetical protein